ncbi:hypothetical protein FKP32DRAFT_1760393 [Trametes sanguinea]|nr:hypothetical protein FKP32DRAFT_1760393 [Trametes sanguinea]
MLSRTAEYAAHAPRSMSPALHMLDPEQRLRLAKSSQKIGKMLGEMPIIDVVPASPPGSISSGMTSFSQVPLASWPLKDGRKGAKFKRRAAPPPAPILRYKLPPPKPLFLSVEEVVSPVRRPRKAIPRALDLSSPLRRPESSPFSPLRNSYLKTPITPEYISPLSPLSPLSPITTPDLQEHRLRNLGQLARRSRAFRDTVVGELPLPSLAHSGQPLDSVKTYLDLYRMSVKIHPRHSQLLPGPGRRRSHSVGQLQRRSIVDMLSVHSAGARTSFLPPPSAASAQNDEGDTPFILALGSPARDVSPSASSSPSTDDSPLQQQQSVAQAKAVILGADARLMETFRRGFGMDRAASTSSQDADASTSLPTPFRSLKSPKVPYWVRSAYRARESMHGSAVRRRRASSAARPPPTPRTMRKERRQGWGGEWKRGKMGAVVEKLKEVDTKIEQSVE